MESTGSRNVEMESANTNEFSAIDEFIQPWTLDVGLDDDQNMIISETDGNEISSVINSELEENEFSQDSVEILRNLNDQKDREIKALFEVIKGLRNQLDTSENILSELELENEQFIVIDSNIDKGNLIQISASESAQAVTKLSSDLMEKHAKIRILSFEMLNLQDKLFGTVSYSLETSKNYKTSEEFAEESFNLVVSFLYDNLQLNDILACRMVCRSWRDTTDTFLNTHPSTVPFDKDTHAQQLRKLKHGRMPTWNESPLRKLAKAYKFSDLGVLKAFIDNNDNMHSTIVGSTVILNNIILTSGPNIRNKTPSFLTIFGAHIRFLTIRQSVKSPDFKIQLLMDRVIACLKKLPNLQHLKLVFCIDKDKIETKKVRDALEALGNETYENWQSNSFPQLEKLVSLEVFIENWTKHGKFLEIFSKTLNQPYTEQLKQLCIFAHGMGPSEGLVVPNLAHLSIAQTELHNVDFKYKQKHQNLQKCTITNFGCRWASNNFDAIQRCFPNLTCLGFTFEHVRGKFRWEAPRYAMGGPSFPRPSFPRLPSVLTLELENCGVVEFTILECFPNLSSIKLINKPVSKKIKDSKDTVLNITKLLEGLNLYESREFWEHFPNISLILLEYSGEASRNIKPRMCRWTRDGYAKYWCNSILIDDLQEDSDSDW